MTTKRGLTLLALAVLALGVLDAACGEGDSETGATPPGNGADRAFASDMIPHHRSAVEMAAVAKQRSSREEIQQLADAIVTSQNAEIEQLTAVDQTLEDAGVEAGDRGVAHHEMGMDDDASMLEDAKPFATTVPSARSASRRVTMCEPSAALTLPQERRRSRPGGGSALAHPRPSRARPDPARRCGVGALLVALYRCVSVAVAAVAVGIRGSPEAGFGKSIHDTPSGYNILGKRNTPCPCQEYRDDRSD